MTIGTAPERTPPARPRAAIGARTLRRDRWWAQPMINAAGLLSRSCHSCRHIFGGRLNSFSRHPLRYRFWTYVSALNRRHMQIGWVSLIWVASTDLDVRLVASGTITDVRFF
jgi:hypothetical protein